MHPHPGPTLPDAIAALAAGKAIVSFGFAHLEPHQADAIEHALDACWGLLHDLREEGCFSDGDIPLPLRDRIRKLLGER